MKKLVSILLVLSLLVLSGCSKDKREINVFLPGEYISEDVVSAFEDETGIRVNINTFASNEEMYTKLLGGTVYDVLIPSDYMIEKLKDDKMIQPIDKNIVTNLDQLYDGVKNKSYDPDNELTVPYFWGNVGIVYDTRKIDRNDVESDGWEIFHNTKYKGLNYIYDSERDEFMIALKALGYSMNTTNEDELNKAFEWLKQISDKKSATYMEPAFVTDEAIEGLAYPEDNDEKYLGIMYSGDAAYILSENENADFFVPEEGTNYFVDAMCIHAKSENYEEANEFINFMISYDAQYENSLYVGYSSVNAEALNELANGEYANNNAYLPRVMGSLDEEFHNNEDVRKIISDLWVRVKNN